MSTIERANVKRLHDLLQHEETYKQVVGEISHKPEELVHLCVDLFAHVDELERFLDYIIDLFIGQCIREENTDLFEPAVRAVKLLEASSIDRETESDEQPSVYSCSSTFHRCFQIGRLFVWLSWLKKRLPKSPRPE